MPQAAPQQAVQHLGAFCREGEGGNPAGVQVCTGGLPAREAMLATAKAVGYSETAFLAAAPDIDGHDLRFFAPELEIPFCGHATLAAAAVLGAAHGAGEYRLRLASGGVLTVACRPPSVSFRAPPCSSAPPGEELLEGLLKACGIPREALMGDVAPSVIDAGGTKGLLLPVSSLPQLRGIRYDFETSRKLLAGTGIAVIYPVFLDAAAGVASARCFFPPGGVYEDPATGSLAAALGSYLKHSGILRSDRLVVLQGDSVEPIPVPCRIEVDTSEEVPGLQGPVLSGTVRVLER